MGIKLYRLARDLEKSDEELLVLAQEAGLAVKSHLETIVNEDLRVLYDSLGINGAGVEPVYETPEPAHGGSDAEIIAELNAEADAQRAAAIAQAEVEAAEEARALVAAAAESVERPAPEPAPEAPAAPSEPAAPAPPSGAQIAAAAAAAVARPAPPPDNSTYEVSASGTQVKVFEANPAQALMAASGGATHAVDRKRSEQEQEILDRKLEALLHRQHGVTGVTPSMRPPKQQSGRTGRSGPKTQRDRAKEKQEALQRIRARRESTVARQKAIVISIPVTLKDLSQQLGVKANEIIQHLIRQHQTMVTINQHLDEELVELIALHFEKDVEVRKVKAAEEHLSELEETRDEQREENLVSRPPVVAILGHVDHGKTSILDKIRDTNVQAGEAGGITQHLSAWQVNHNGRDLTFIDTPGHAVFTHMRARGAHATDIVVLVVAADDGVMPQTLEAINHAKAAGTPIIVAMNKIDKENANPEKAMQQLAAHELQAEEWGGETPFVKCSAITGEGIDELLEMIEVVAEVEDFKANPDMPARGVVLEGKKDEGRGNIATILIQEGTLRLGDAMLAGLAHGKVRAMNRGLGGKRLPVKEAGPATPLEVTGLSDVPDAGDRFYVLENLSKAKEISDDRIAKDKATKMSDNQRVSLDSIFKITSERAVEQIQLIVKADVKGTVEALGEALAKQSTDEVKLKIIHTAVGGVNESDVLLADASDAIILAFGVAPEDRARALADEKHVEIRQYTVIYELLADVRKAMEGLLAPDLVENVLGRAEIRKVFRASRLGNIGGSYVTSGVIRRNAKVRLIRDGKILHNRLDLESLKRFKDDVREVKENFECGIKIKNFEDIKDGDIVEAYEINEVARTLDE